jgi:hypothetical protein
MAITVLDPVAQTFIIDKDSFPEGAFLSSIRLFFRSKPSNNVPIKLSIVPTVNGFPSGNPLDYSQVTLYPNDVKVSESPQYVDSTTYTNFTFPVPVFIRPDALYAMIIQSNASGYKLWTAAQNDIPLASSVKELPTDATPTSLTKISKSPYVGSFFESQNGITYTADQTKDLMFVINRCSFSTTANPSLDFVVPAGLQQRKYIEQTFTKQTANVTYDELNISTTHFVPTSTNINYSYISTLNSDGSSTGALNVTPGELGTPLSQNIKLNDNRGLRVLVANSNTSFILNATLQTSDNRMSPILSDDGLSLYTVKYNINNLGLSNTDFSIISGGTGYLGGDSGDLVGNVTISAPNEVGGEQAYVTANVTSGNITSIYVTTEGSGYSKTPTITISAANTTSAQLAVTGETSTSGGNAKARYLTYPVTLAQNSDSGDLRVFLTSYRPTNTNIYVYYKLLSREDTQTFEQSDWQLMTITNNSTKYSRNETELYEFEFAPGINGVEDNFVSYISKASGYTYNYFYKYAIKVIMTTTDSTISPYLTDIRVLALPPGSSL